MLLAKEELVLAEEPVLALVYPDIQTDTVRGTSCLMVEKLATLKDLTAALWTQKKHPLKDLSQCLATSIWFARRWFRVEHIVPGTLRLWREYLPRITSGLQRVVKRTYWYG